MKRALVIALLAVAACDSSSQVPALRHEAVVVYAPYADEAYLTKLLSSFTDETDIPVTIRYGESAKLTDDVILDRGTPPADVLITDDVADIWRAANRGALRPIQSPAFANHHPTVKDADRQWAAIRMRQQAIVRRNDARPLKASFEDLGTADFQGRLCLSSSELPDNRALIAYLIEELGVREAERLVRRWIRNLAEPPFVSQQAMLEAMRAGACDYGIGDMRHDLDGLTPFVQSPYFFNVTAAGIGRHAVQADAAQLLVDWLLRNSAVRLTGDGQWASLEIAGWRNEEAVLLAERAGYR